MTDYEATIELPSIKIRQVMGIPNMEDVMTMIRGMKIHIKEKNQ